MDGRERKLFVQALMLSVLLHLAAGCSKKVTSVPVETAPLILPNNIGPILVLVDHLPGNDAFVEARAQQVAIGLRHFSGQTSWQYIDAAPLGTVQSAVAVVYLGLNGNTPPSSDALARLRRARHLIVSRYHLATLREAGVAFQHTEGGNDIGTPADTMVHYKGQTFPCPLPDFLNFKIEGPARVVAGYVLPDKTAMPFIVQDGDALFVNGEISFDSGETAWRGGMLTVVDGIEQFIGAQPLPGRPQAMLRLEDVSAVTPYRQLDSIVHYLAATRVPYGMGVIPDLRLKGKTVRPLAQNHELLGVLRWAEEHGATTVLHGLHHCCSSDNVEGYEFWDADRNAPLSSDSVAWMRLNVSEGLADLTTLGLHPHIWETPHYSASPQDYEAVSEFFSAAWERRRPLGWLPWVLKSDQYGAMLLPDDLGYVSLDGKMTVADQLARAKELLVCQGCLAAGFIHPNTVPLGDVQRYVEGLRDLGYTFVDPGQVPGRTSASR